MHALPTQRSASQAGEIGLGSRFIQEDQLSWVQACLAASPLPSGSCYVRAVLLAGAECLFLYVRPISSSA